MQLISDIINELVDSEKSINGPLLKTKVLATRLKNQSLLEWVNNELNGCDNDKTPKYRTFKGHATATYINGSYTFNDQPIPTTIFGKDFEEGFTTINLNQGVFALETMSNNGGGGSIEIIFTAEIISILEYLMKKNGNNPWLQVLSARKSLPANIITQTLAVIRSKLLDFMLKLDEEFGNKTEIELKSLNKQITNIMYNTITGDGNVLNSGNENCITANIQINKGNKDELKERLSKSGIEQEDITQLVEVIDTEEPNKEKGTFGLKVNNWIQKMFAKAVDGSWQIGIGAAGTLLAEAIQTYYGIK